MSGPLKLLKEPLAWNNTDRYEDGENPVLLDREPFIDWRLNEPRLRIGDGKTPGGHLVSASSNLARVLMPLIVNPIYGMVGMDVQPLFEATDFKAQVPDGSELTHKDSRWIFFKDEDQTEILYDSGWTEESLTRFDASAWDFFFEGTVWARVTYRASNGMVANSNVTRFTVGGVV